MGLGTKRWWEKGRRTAGCMGVFNSLNSMVGRLQQVIEIYI